MGWTKAPLGDLGTWRGGGTPSKAVPRFWDGDIPWVSPKDMKVDRIRDSIDHISREAVERSATNLVSTGAVLVVTRSGILSHSLPVAVTDGEVALNQDLKALVPAVGVMPEYVAWALRSAAPRVLRECSKAGTTVSNIDTNRMLGFQVPLAPTNEQRRIVAAIEEHLSRLDSADASVALALRRLHSHREAVLRQAFSVSAPRVGVGDVASLADGPFGSNLKTSHYTTSGPRVIRLQNIGDGAFRDEYAHIAAAHFESLRKHEVVAGDVVAASLGEEAPRACRIPAYVGPAIVKADCIRIRPRDGVDAAYLMWSLNSPQIKELASARIKGIGRPRLGLGGLRQLLFPLPPLAEQRRIVAELEEQLSAIDALRAALERAQRRSATLRRAILERAFRGELVPQDPSDEPASMLMQRIQTDRFSQTSGDDRARQ